MTNVENFNDQSMGEEIANAVSHGTGAALAAGGTAVLIVRACLHSDAIGIVCACLYGFSLIFLYCMSTLYHALANPKAKKVFQVFDHCSIFILILGTYIPICLSLLGGWEGWTLLGINAFLAVLGITANAISVKKWHKASLLLYLLMGWSVLGAFGPLLEKLTPGGLAFLLCGGICYCVGILFYTAAKPRFMHSVWHLLVLSGSICHYFFILLYVL